MTTYYEKPIYGLRAAEAWNEITGNYPLLPDSAMSGGGSVLLNSGKSLHVVGFFGFQAFPDQVMVFESYLKAEKFYQAAKDQPLSYRSRPPSLDLLKDVPGDKEIEARQRPRHAYEGSGSRED